MGRGIAFRRAQRKRIVNKVKSFIWWTDDPKVISQYATTPQPCSCWLGCGNRRKYKGPTLQEVKQYEEFEEELKDI